MPPNTESEPTIPRKIVTEEDLQARLKQGQAVFVFENKVYKVNHFLDKHPGGDLAIRHVLGRDVTDEIRSMHPPRVYEKLIHRFYVGDYVPNLTHVRLAKSKDRPLWSERQRLEAEWGTNFSVQAFDDAIGQLHDHHARDLAQDAKDQEGLDAVLIRDAFRRLEQSIKDRGLFQCNYYRYGKECCRYVLFIYLSLWLAFRGTATWHYLASAVFMAAFWHQLMFTAHDAGHNEITGKVEIDHIIGVIIANFIGGMSIGWWKDNHNVHHIVTNDPEHDPDIQHLPFLAITTKFFSNIYSTYYKKVLKFDAFARFFVRYQHHLYYLILSFGRFNLHRLSFNHVLFARHVRTRRLELIGIMVFFIWYSYFLSYIPSWPLRVAYLFISYMLTFPLHVQITLSHFGMSTEDFGKDDSFPAKMLRTTMDVDCPEWLDWVHGGLQYQAVHHLFPRLPRHNLRQCVPLVRQFCKETGLRYYMYNFSTGNGVVLGALKSVADQVGLMNDVAKYNAKVWHGDLKKSD
ncbi:delta-6 fatty acid desaturase [Radiomyces spectabilis]|uniref:delta-6 fatty acid desaturase n=1 Tax=Radiomyces spectabilis TaxID=64574 RepID=UPI00221FC9F0|nr:delta-6 fatty acid desaturase [Radiomyces spectabilis]KAI8364751.1 delta-6 fatty acid desaturase [Radiomyces spectabilis]